VRPVRTYTQTVRLPTWLTRSVAPPRTRADATPTPALARPVTAPTRRQGPYSWDLERIRRARDCQLRGDFELPVRLAEGFRTDDALFNAFQARVATQGAIRLAWRSALSDAGRVAGARAERLVCIPQHVRQSILGTMANHGVAIGYVEQTALDTPEGPSLRFCLTEWPLEHVRYNVSTDTLETRTLELGTIPITHGDGRWVVFRKFGVMPWTQDAALLPGAFLWAAHAEGLSDWASASEAHGRPFMIGELPDGVPLGNGSGGLSSDAQLFISMLQDLVSGNAGAGVRPFGSKTDYVTNGSQAWQIFKELITNREGAAARIYLGTDAILGSRGGAPGVDVAALFGIATTRIQGDLEALERGFREGLILPWCALHGVAVEDAPAALYEIPDVDAQKKSEQEHGAIVRFAETVAALKSSGVQVSQDVADHLARVLGVSVPVVLAAAEDKSVPLPLAPTDVARVITVREARESQGLPPLGDERDDMFVAELEELARQKTAEAAAQAAAEAAPEQPEAPAPEQPEAEVPAPESAE
jgi:hypothetical protein